VFQINQADLDKMAAELEAELLAEFFPPPPAVNSDPSAVNWAELGRRVSDCCRRLEATNHERED